MIIFKLVSQNCITCIKLVVVSGFKRKQNSNDGVGWREICADKTDGLNVSIQEIYENYVNDSIHPCLLTPHVLKYTHESGIP